MRRDGNRLDPELQRLLDQGKIIQRLPAVVRARALARARTMAALPAPASAVRVRWLRVAVAASLALVGGAAVTAVAAVALRGLDLRRLEPTPPSNLRAVPDARITRPYLPPAAPAVAPQPIPKAKLRPERPIATQESYAAELALLQRAQVAYAGRDFAGALALVSEHARQFPNGRLAEEREALRVRSLAGSGHAGGTRRAAAAFAARFPRSVLLPRFQGAAGTAEQQ